MAVPEAPPVNRLTRLRAFIMTSLLSVVAALLIFVLIVQVDVLDGAWIQFLKTMAWFKPVMALAAASPLFAALLVGYGYMDRAMKRRKREQAAAASGH